MYIYVFIFLLHSLSFVFQSVSYWVSSILFVRFKLLLWHYMISVQMYLCVRVLCVFGLMFSFLFHYLSSFFPFFVSIEESRYFFTLVRVTQVCVCVCVFECPYSFFPFHLCFPVYFLFIYVFIQ